MPVNLQSTKSNRKEARAFCRDLARSHYENFTVGSFLLPRRLRQHMYNVYAYCRLSDDFADEELSPEVSLQKLGVWQEHLEACYAGEYRHPVFLALSETIAEFGIPMAPFANLLEAFRQDQIVNRYQTFADLLAYCQNSADPVGRITLYLFGASFDECFRYSDAVCTALQLTNFWQDVTVDLKKDRIYIPHEDMARFGCRETDLRQAKASPAVRELIAFEVSRAQELFDTGRALVSLVPRRVQVEISLFIRGGQAILEAIKKQDYDVLFKRPSLGKATKARLFVQALKGNRRSLAQDKIEASISPSDDKRAGKNESLDLIRPRNPE